jgi:ElaB/YqjD/DUF883 family membrane-anchored ribosome-binding protein
MTQQRSDHPLDYTQGPARGDPSQAAAVATEDRVKDAARNFQPFVRNSMKEQPMATLAVASLVGFVLGALWKK